MAVAERLHCVPMNWMVIVQ